MFICIDFICRTVKTLSLVEDPSRVPTGSAGRICSACGEEGSGARDGASPHVCIA